MKIYQDKMLELVNQKRTQIYRDMIVDQAEISLIKVAKLLKKRPKK